jgi:hypothetical protein
VQMRHHIIGAALEKSVKAAGREFGIRTREMKKSQHAEDEPS